MGTVFPLKSNENDQHQYGQYQYSGCQTIFVSAVSMMKHSKSAGQTKKNPRFTCPHCPYSSNISTNYRHHMLTHTSERPFKCPICGMGFIQKQNMKNHMINHSKKLLFS